MKFNKALSLLSLCQKAGFVISGGFGCEKSLRAGSAGIVVVAHDASAQTTKKFTDKARFYNVPLAVFADKLTLGAAIGKDERAVLVITDRQMAINIKGAIELMELK